MMAAYAAAAAAAGEAPAYQNLYQANATHVTSSATAPPISHAATDTAYHTQYALPNSQPPPQPPRTVPGMLGTSYSDQHHHPGTAAHGANGTLQAEFAIGASHFRQNDSTGLGTTSRHQYKAPLGRHPDGLGLKDAANVIAAAGQHRVVAFASDTRHLVNNAAAASPEPLEEGEMAPTPPPHAAADEDDSPPTSPGDRSAAVAPTDGMATGPPQASGARLLAHHSGAAGQSTTQPYSRLPPHLLSSTGRHDAASGQ